jgi:hypothetical protein
MTTYDCNSSRAMSSWGGLKTTTSSRRASGRAKKVSNIYSIPPSLTAVPFTDIIKAIMQAPEFEQPSQDDLAGIINIVSSVLVFN